VKALLRDDRTIAYGGPRGTSRPNDAGRTGCRSGTNPEEPGHDLDLLDELANVRLRETSRSVLRMDHDPDRHDDCAIGLALAARRLLEGSREPDIGDWSGVFTLTNLDLRQPNPWLMDSGVGRAWP
jgi:hypothetical protein